MFFSLHNRNVYGHIHVHGCGFRFHCVFLRITSDWGLFLFLPPQQPERIRGSRYTITSDIWSLGLTIHEVAMNEFPFPAELASAPIDLLMHVVKMDPPVLVDDETENLKWSKAIRDFLRLWLVFFFSDHRFDYSTSNTDRFRCNFLQLGKGPPSPTATSTAVETPLDKEKRTETARSRQMARASLGVGTIINPRYSIGPRICDRPLFINNNTNSPHVHPTSSTHPPRRSFSAVQHSRLPTILVLAVHLPTTISQKSLFACSFSLTLLLSFYSTAFFFKPIISGLLFFAMLVTSHHVFNMPQLSDFFSPLPRL
jgi:serine/threonine protein kinase